MLNSWPDCVAISKYVARYDFNSDFWFARKMMDTLILKLIFFPLELYNQIKFFWCGGRGSKKLIESNFKARIK